MQATIKSCFVDVDGVKTHYLAGGTGPMVVLLHSGEFGAAAEISWEFNAAALAEHFKVIAPDWLGFGRTDKLRDFVDGRARMIRHMQRFLEVMNVEEADFVGNSMAGGIITRAASVDPPLFPIRRIVLASGGGFSPYNAYRRALIEYNCTIGGMEHLLRAMFFDPKWPEDQAYVKRRFEFSTMPGAWECTATARFNSPLRTAPSDHGQPDTVEYERIPFPTLVVAGAGDKLRLPGYADEMVRRMPNARLELFQECGHCPNIEQAERFNAVVIEFLSGTPNR